ncbi:mpv17-like protein [Agrilus planipennis]|uniref:Mpv17-like protein n=1 Tax=Agrilus planipennis TaxID=224129 RepID=A0A7F5RLJ7_AGRPL|nr:mpv17-like protein [Agrilus planipennis]
MSKVGKLIKHVFEKHPIISNSVAYGILFVSSEISQQVVIKKILTEEKEPLDKKTIGRYAVYGTLLQGPYLTIWFRYLDSKLKGTAYKIVTQKVLLDQFLATPPLYCLFFIAMSLLEGREDCTKELKEKFLTTFKTSCMFWLPVQTINFLLVPPSFRVIYVGTCSLTWVNILCWIKRQ